MKASLATLTCVLFLPETHRARVYKDEAA